MRSCRIQWNQRVYEFPVEFSGKLSLISAKVEEMDILLNEGEVLPISQPPDRYLEVVKKFI